MCFSSTDGRARDDFIFFMQQSNGKRRSVKLLLFYFLLFNALVKHTALSNDLFVELCARNASH